MLCPHHLWVLDSNGARDEGAKVAARRDEFRVSQDISHEDLVRACNDVGADTRFRRGRREAKARD